MSNSSEQVPLTFEQPALTREEQERLKTIKQIKRVGQRLGQRASDMSQVIEATNTPDNKIVVAGGYVAHIKSNKQAGTHSNTNLNGQYPMTKVIRTEENTKSLFVGNLTANTKENEDMPVPLTNEQLRHTAAGVLSNLSGELSRRSIEHTAKSKTDHDDIIDA